MIEEIIENNPAILPAHWLYRPHTFDWNIYDSVCLHNEYALPNPMPKGVVIDIGSHIGSFLWACKCTQVTHAVGYELCTSNFNLLQNNIKPIKNYKVVHAAVWSDTECPDWITEPRKIKGANTGGSGPYNGPDGLRVQVIHLHDAIEDALAFSGGQRVRLIKLDCEGCEYPILSGSNLQLVDALCGEFHDGFRWKDRLWTGHDAAQMITDQGFHIRLIHTNPGFWRFWADKPSFYQ